MEKMSHCELRGFARGVPMMTKGMGSRNITFKTTCVLNWERADISTHIFTYLCEHMFHKRNKTKQISPNYLFHKRFELDENENKKTDQEFLFELLCGACFW